MNGTGFFHGGKRSVENPLGPLAPALQWHAAISGIAAIIATVAGWRAATGAVPDPAAAVSLLIGGLFLVSAIRLLSKARMARRPVLVPARAPDDFVHINELKEGLVRREAPAYSLTPRLVRFVSNRFKVGAGGIYATPPKQAVLRATMKGTIDVVFVMVLSVALLAGAVVYDRFLVPAGVGIAVQTGLLVVIGLALGAGGVSHLIQRGRLMKVLVEDEEPAMARLEHIQSAEGAGDPFLLRSEFEHRLLRLREDGVPNRVDPSTDWSSSKGTVHDSGTFDGTFILETQPVPEENPATTLGVPYARAAIAGRAAGAAGFSLAAVSVPFLLRGGAVGVAESSVLLVASWIILAWGSGMLRDGLRLSEAFRWRSTAVVVDAKGTMGRSEIKAGRGISDSFETSNLVVRSDCQFHVYAAQVLSESRTVEGPRYILATAPGPEAAKAMELVKAALDGFEHRGVQVRRIDPEGGALADTAKLNAMARAVGARIEEGHGALTAGEVEDLAKQFEIPSAVDEPSGPGEDDGHEGDRLEEGPEESAAGPQEVDGSQRGQDTVASASETGGKTMIKCPSCGTIMAMHPRFDPVCSACGYH